MKYLLLVLVFFGVTQMSIGQMADPIERANLFCFSDGVKTDRFHNFQDVFEGHPVVGNDFQRYMRMRRSQRIINYACVGTFVAAGVGSLIANEIDDNQFSGVGYYILMLGVGGLTGSVLLVSNGIILPIQATRRKRIVDGYNDSLMSSKPSMQTRIGICDNGLGLQITF